MTRKAKIRIVFLASWVMVPLFLDPVWCLPPRIEVAQDKNSQVVDYFVAGTLNQPSQAFDFLFDEPILSDDDLKIVPYRCTGADFTAIVDLIRADIIQNGYQKARIFAISVGCSVTHDFNLQDVQGVEIACYEVNPCFSGAFLQPDMRRTLTIGYPFIVALDTVLGPLKYVSVVPASNALFSVHLTRSQVKRTLQDEPLTAEGASHTRGVILSGEDEFLDNDVISAFYDDKQVILLPGVSHGDTIRSAEEYRKAIHQLLLSE